MSWRVKFYQTQSGQSPVIKFMESLQKSTRAKLTGLFELLSEYGPALGMPHAKPVCNGIYELRVRGREEIRSLYIFQIGNEVIILHGFKKKTMAITRKDLAIARQRKKRGRELSPIA